MQYRPIVGYPAFSYHREREIDRGSTSLYKEAYDLDMLRGLIRFQLYMHTKFLFEPFHFSLVRFLGCGQRRAAESIRVWHRTNISP